MNVLAVDMGGTHVKFLVTSQKNHREFPSGPALTAKQMVVKVLNATRGWTYDVVSIGYPGPVLRGRPVGARRRVRVTPVEEHHAAHGN